MSAVAVRYPAECECEVALIDGTVASVRPIRPGDAAALADFHDHLSRETIYRRFFSSHPHLQDAEVQRFTRVDYQDRLALVAEIGGRLAAVARFDRQGTTSRDEVAFVVADSYQGRGLGTVLLEHLAAAARHRGVRVFVAEVLVTNRPMQRVFHQTGFRCEQHSEGGVVDLSFSIEPTDGYLDALLDRDARAVHAWLRGRVPPAPPGGLGRSLSLVGGLLGDLPRSAVRPARPVSGGGDRRSRYRRDDRVGVPGRRRQQRGHRRGGGHVAPDRGSLWPRRGRPPGANRSWPWSRGGRSGRGAGRRGVECFDDAERLLTRAQETLVALRSGRWRPVARGALVEVDGCDPARARALLDRHDTLAGNGYPATQELAPGLGADLLAAYGVATPATRAFEQADGVEIMVGDGGAAVFGPGRGFQTPAGEAGLIHLLPLTDRDAEELVAGAVPGLEAQGAVVDAMVRIARLVDDQLDVRSVKIRLGPRPGSADRAASVWIGPSSCSDDDPFSPRLCPPLTGATSASEHHRHLVGCRR